MANITGIKNSFASGEFSPALYSRTDLERYVNAAKTLKNVIVHPHGPASNRPGLEYIATGKTDNKKIRLIPFEFSTTQTYVLEFGEYYCRFYTDGVQIENADSYDSYVKLMMHNNASPFTDEIGKTIVDGVAWDTYTKLMLHCNGVDGSTTFTDEIGKTVTAVGTAQIDTAQYKFGGASLLLDGDSDYLSTVDHADWNFTADFTIDFQARWNDKTGTQVFVSQYVDGNNQWLFRKDADDKLTFFHLLDSYEASYTTISAVTLSNGTWYHIAFVRSGNSAYIFVDGISYTLSVETAFSAALTNLAAPLQIGSLATLNYFNGWLDEFRISKGIARWTADFTAPTVAYGTAPALDTSVKKFGAASALFYNIPGYGGYNYVADSADWYFGSGNFSIDFQVNFLSLTGKQGFIGQYEDADNYWYLLKNADNTLSMIFKYSGTIIAYYTTTSAPSFSASTWYHLEFTRNGANAYIFVDGVSQALTTAVSFGSSDVGNIAATLDIGWDEVDNVFFTGNIDELRVSKGTARHTVDFTAPIAEYAAGTVLEVVTPYAEADLANIQYTQSADVLYLASPNYSPRELVRSAATSWALNEYAYVNGPFQIQNIDTTKTLAISAVSGTGKTLTAVGFTFNTLHVGSLWRLSHDIEGQSVSAALASVTTSSAITCGGTWRLITHGTWTGTIQIEKSIDSGSTWTMLREFSSAADFNANTYGTEDMSNYALPFQLRINMTAYTSGTCNINLTSDPYIHEGICEITAVAAGGATATADVIRAFGATTATIDWWESSWSDYAGWPSIVEFHPEDRLVWGNTATEPYTYWMTKSSNYTSFERNNPLVDSDSIASPVPARKVNGINGLIPLSEMVALTLSNEIGIRSSSGPLSPTTIYNRIYGWEGSYGVKPIVIGNRAIYIQSTGTIVRDLGFILEQDSFVGDDLSIFSKHLFEDYTITEIAYQQNPDRLVWAVRSDGKLLSMTYMREQEVVAWTQHDTGTAAAGTDSFESVCSVRGTGYDEIWVSVKRGTTRYIERMDKRLSSTASEDSFFVDCGTKYDSTATTTVTGLTHLASKAVSVLADGVVISGKTVSAGGVLTLDTAASVVNVGLAYNSDIELLNYNVKLEQGTVQGRKIKPSRGIFRVLKTRGGYVGPSSSSLYAMGIGSASALFSGDHPQTIAGGYTSGGRIFIRQSDPLPITITGIIIEYEVGGLTQTVQ